MDTILKLLVESITVNHVKVLDSGNLAWAISEWTTKENNLTNTKEFWDT